MEPLIPALSPQLSVLHNRHLFRMIALFLSPKDILSLAATNRACHQNSQNDECWIELLRRDYAHFILTRPLPSGTLNSTAFQQYELTVPVSEEEQQRDYRIEEQLQQKIDTILNPEATQESTESRLEQTLLSLGNAAQGRYRECHRLSKLQYGGVFKGRFATFGDQDIQLHSIGYHLFGVKLEGLNVFPGKINIDCRFTADFSYFLGKIQLADFGYKRPRWQLVLGQRIDENNLIVRILFEYYLDQLTSDHELQAFNIEMWRRETQSPDLETSNQQLKLKFLNDGQDGIHYSLDEVLDV